VTSNLNTSVGNSLIEVDIAPTAREADIEANNGCGSSRMEGTRSDATAGTFPRDRPSSLSLCSVASAASMPALAIRCGENPPSLGQ
jgi:hypothetical protein